MNDLNVPEATSTLVEMISASWMSQAVCVAAELRIADLLANGAKDINELASTTQCQAASLNRLMRALASLGLCTECTDGSFGLTASGALLQTGGAPSLRAWAIWWGRYRWSMWGELRECVSNGHSKRQLSGSRAGYSYHDNDPAAAAVFNRAMVELTRLAAVEVLRAYDFSTVGRLVDVGGGHGELLAALLAAHPRMQGTLFDLPPAIAGAAGHLAAFVGRCELIAGSFFEAVPGGADVYMMKSVLHSWDDERSLTILRNCHRAMPKKARLVLVERIMPAQMHGGAGERSVARSDLHMLVGSGGRERTQAEFSALLADAGFGETKFIPAGPDYWVVEAVPEPRCW